MIEGFLDDPGNIFYKFLEFEREELSLFWRLFLKERLIYGFWDILFYYKDKPALFVSCIKLEEIEKI
jgi:hypothetical protein